MKRSVKGIIPSQAVMRLAIGGQGPRNWLKGSVESVVKDLMSNGPTEADREWILEHAEHQRELGQNPAGVLAGLDAIPRVQAINQWIERNLTNYIKKQMAGHDDPIRKLAEQGIVHFAPEQDEEQREHAQYIRKAHDAPQL